MAPCSLQGPSAVRKCPGTPPKKFSTDCSGSTPSTDSTEWSITLVDLTTSGESTLKLPDMTFTYTQTDEETGESKEVTEAPTFLLLKWQDDKNLVVTASLAEYDSSKQPQTWVYTLP